MKTYKLASTVLAGALLLAGCNGGNGGGLAVPDSFRAAATFRVPAPGTTAEIASVSPDGRTLAYTDAAAGLVGFVNIADLAAVAQLGTVAVGGEPTSVAMSRDGLFALAVVAGINRLVVIEVATRTVIRSITLPGQPDCIKISPSGSFAAIALENQRPDESRPLPVAPAGALSIVNIGGAPSAWTLRTVTLAGRDGLRFPTDPEPEFISINALNKAVVSLQENNAIAVVDLPSGTIERSFSAGSTTHAADLQNDGTASFVDTLTNARREPDGLAWTPRGNIITANEGDYDLDLAAGQFVGGRNFSIFSPTGTVIFDDNGTMERETARAGRYPDNRSTRKGSEPESVEVGTFGARSFAFVALERADALAVFRLDSESSPTFVQILPTGDAPEGVVVVPARNMVITANEGDGTISFFTS